jgi:hypothetical protein
LQGLFHLLIEKLTDQEHQEWNLNDQTNEADCHLFTVIILDTVTINLVMFDVESDT